MCSHVMVECGSVLWGMLSKVNNSDNFDVVVVMWNLGIGEVKLSLVTFGEVLALVKYGNV